jgi:hypothetical protein
MAAVRSNAGARAATWLPLEAGALGEVRWRELGARADLLSSANTRRAAQLLWNYLLIQAEYEVAPEFLARMGRAQHYVVLKGGSNGGRLAARLAELKFR